jgi:hypothetical protein
MTGRPSEATIWDVPAPVRPATPLRLPRASANAEELRWRGQAVTAPIERLVRAAANTVHDEDRYDLRRLAHRAIDLAVASMGFARELTDDELLEALAAFASRMAPEVSADEHRAVAAFVRKTLLNEQGDFAKFAFTGFDEEGGRHPFAFHLLTLRDAGEDTVVRASPEAINVFLRALDLDVTDAEAAVGVMLERQLADGRFEAAETSAVAASRASVAYAATLGNLLEDTRRDVTALDWRGSVRDEIETARRHVASRILEDDRLTEHVREGIEAPEEHVRGSAGRIAGILRECKEIHLDLEGRLVGANQAFLDAQREQQLARRTRLRLLSIERELLGPVLALPRAAATEITTLFAEEVLGLVATRSSPTRSAMTTPRSPPRPASSRARGWRRVGSRRSSGTPPRSTPRSRSKPSSSSGSSASSRSPPRPPTTTRILASPASSPTASRHSTMARNSTTRGSPGQTCSLAQPSRSRRSRISAMPTPRSLSTRRPWTTSSSRSSAFGRPADERARGRRRRPTRRLRLLAAPADRRV